VFKPLNIQISEISLLDNIQIIQQIMTFFKNRNSNSLLLGQLRKSYGSDEHKIPKPLPGTEMWPPSCNIAVE
jgi:hypothetical protein